MPLIPLIPLIPLRPLVLVPLRGVPEWKEAERDMNAMSMNPEREGERKREC